MENEIKVGEFIRTNRGHIGKIKRIELDKIDKSLKWYVFDHKEFEINIIKEEYINKPYIVKHSSDLIDLIEEGDYVNGKKVKHIAMFEGFPDYPKLIFVDEYRLIPGETAENDEIKSIVTKEQFEQMKYIVGDE